MPLIDVTTNQQLEAEQRAFAVQRLSAITAEALGKSERYVMANLVVNPDMRFAGEATPTALVRLCSIGLPMNRTNELSATLCEAIQELLQVPKDRTYIEFNDVERPLWGWNGSTFG